MDCARPTFGHGPQMTWPLAGRLGLARFLIPAPPADHLPPVPGTALPATKPAAFTAAGCSPRRDTLTRSPPTMTTNSPPDARNARIYVATANVAVMDILSGREQMG